LTSGGTVIGTSILATRRSRQLRAHRRAPHHRPQRLECRTCVRAVCSAVDAVAAPQLVAQCADGCHLVRKDGSRVVNVHRSVHCPRVNWGAQDFWGDCVRGRRCPEVSVAHARGHTDDHTRSSSAHAWHVPAVSACRG
jgi:hypothetical protein